MTIGCNIVSVSRELSYSNPARVCVNQQQSRDTQCLTNANITVWLVTEGSRSSYTVVREIPSRG